MSDVYNLGVVPKDHMWAILGMGLVLAIAPHPIAVIEKYKFPSWQWSVLTIILFVAGVMYITVDSPFLYFQF